jgi:hypothetical protein
MARCGHYIRELCRGRKASAYEIGRSCAESYGGALEQRLCTREAEEVENCGMGEENALTAVYPPTPLLPFVVPSGQGLLFNRVGLPLGGETTMC